MMLPTAFCRILFSCADEMLFNEPITPPVLTVVFTNKEVVVGVVVITVVVDVVVLVDVVVSEY